MSNDDDNDRLTAEFARQQNYVPSVAYNIIIASPDQEILVLWGEESAWAERHAAAIAAAERVTLTPKDEAAHLPVLSVALGEGRKLFLTSRVFGVLDGESRPVRIHGIGWKMSSGDQEIEAISWIYPNGSVEIASDPSFWKLFIGV